MSLELWSLIAQAVTGVGAFAIAAVAFYHSRKMQRLEAINQYIGRWRELNRLSIESERLRLAQAQLAGLESPPADADVGYLCSIYVNQALAAWYTWRFGGLPRVELNAEFDAIWATVARRADVTSAMIHAESFPPRFVAMFEERRQRAAR